MQKENSKELLIICSECDTVWDTPELYKNNKPNIDFLIDEKLIEPTNDEIKQSGWSDYIVDNIS